MDAKIIINTIIEASEKDKAGTSTEKTVEEHEAIGAEAPGVENMELGPEQPAQNLLPFLLQFGRKAPRTPRPRQPVLKVPLSPSPPDSKKSDDSMRSSPSEKSDDSMRSGPSDPDDSDYNPEEEV